MARAIPAAISSAISAPGAQPSLTVTSADIIHRPALLASTGAPIARTHAILTSAGSILRAAVTQHADPNSLTIFRITSPATASQWTAAGTVISSTVQALAACSLVQTGSTIRCFYVNSSSNSLCYRDSTNDGVTWSAESVVAAANPSVPVCSGIAAISTTSVLSAWYTYPQAANILYQNTYSAGWSALTSVGPTTPSWGQLRGIAVDTHSGTSVLHAGAQLRFQQSGIAAAAATLSGSTWTGFLATHNMDSADNGLALSFPTVHFNPADGYYYSGLNLQDSGIISGTVQNRISIWRSTDGITWQLVQSLGNVLNLEPHVLFAGNNLYIFDNQTVYLAPASLPPTDLTPDVLALDIHETSDHSSTFILRLSNQNGQYNALPNLRDNAQLAISLGYNGQTIQTHAAFIDALEYVCQPDSQELIVHARDLTKFLDQICTLFTSISSQTVGQIATQLCKNANVALDTLPTTSQFSQIISCFTVLPGESWYQALLRLGAIFDFETIDTLVAGSPQVKLVERLANDASTWSYGQETLGIAWQLSADQPNIIRVVGSGTTTTNIFAEVTDSANMFTSGVHRYRHIVDRLCDTSAKCLLKAQLALRDDQTQAKTGSLTVTINPQHEVLDVIQITDARLALVNQPARIEAITTQIDFQSGLWTQHLSLALP